MTTVCLFFFVIGRVLTRLDRFRADDRNDYDEEIAYESYMNPEPSFQSSQADSVDSG